LITAFLALLLLVPQQDDFQAQFSGALKALHERNFEAARTGLQAAGKLHPADPHVWVALAETYWKLGNTESAAEAAGKAEKLGANDPITRRGLAIFYSEQGKAYEANGQSAKAIQQLQAAIRLKPDEESYHFDLIEILLRHYDFKGAIQQSEAALKKFPKSAQLTLAAGVAYYGQDQAEPAIGKFLQTIALDPSIEQPYIFLARVINRAHAHLPAITQRFAEFQEKNPESYLGYFMHAKALDAQFQEPELAENLLRKSISLNGDYWESHYELAILLEKKGAIEEAEKEFRRTTELNPKEPSPHYRLCRVLAKLGRTTEAQAEAAVLKKATEEYREDLNRRLATVQHLSNSR
jgi:tetratricopeptide (TPR) repeat protein